MHASKYPMLVIFPATSELKHLMLLDSVMADSADPQVLQAASSFLGAFVGICTRNIACS